jgi:hypothetical protein
LRKWCSSSSARGRPIKPTNAGQAEMIGSDEFPSNLFVRGLWDGYKWKAKAVAVVLCQVSRISARILGT